ncbi:MAG: hypothetical protein F9K23_16790 [Bacteroidetes bacterium]|nr:MAG: hypothetical protein F9K23_16790 [Bacteroidota bacterium]
MQYVIRALVLFCFVFLAGELTASPVQSANDSAVVTYHENGQVKEKGSYRNGLKHGKWKEYDAEGVILKMTKYKNGEFKWERLYKNGKLSQITDKKGRVHKMKDCGC